MRKIQKIQRAGDVRIIKKFAWFPVSVVYCGIEETRWLEKVKIRQVYCLTWHDHYWENERFI